MISKAEIQAIWNECLGVDTDIEKRAVELRHSICQRRKAWDKLAEIYKGKTAEQLERIWTTTFYPITRKYYQDTTLFPDAFESSRVRAKRWTTRTCAKKYYFLARMQGLKRSKNFRPIKEKEIRILIDTLENHVYELIVRYQSLTVNEMRRIVACTGKLFEILTRHPAKNEVKAKLIDEKQIKVA